MSSRKYPKEEANALALIKQNPGIRQKKLAEDLALAWSHTHDQMRNMLGNLLATGRIYHARTKANENGDWGYVLFPDAISRNRAYPDPDSWTRVGMGKKHRTNGELPPPPKAVEATPKAAPVEVGPMTMKFTLKSGNEVWLSLDDVHELHQRFKAFFG